MGRRTQATVAAGIRVVVRLNHKRVGGDEMKVLNLYAGIGGNRTLWKDVEVTAVEYDSRIASVYQERFKNDEVIVDDCIHYVENTDLSGFDFIWASPPCQTHSMFNMVRGVNVPDMTNLYGMITFLSYGYKGLWVVENVRPWYTPLIPPSVKLGRHYFWGNFLIPEVDFPQYQDETIDNLSIKQLRVLHGIPESLLPGNHIGIRQILRNCVDKEIGLYILNCARRKATQKQTQL